MSTDGIVNTGPAAVGHEPDFGELTMPGVMTPAEQRVILHNLSWETYERILSESVNSSVPRFTFDHGELEIMSPSAEPERYSRRIDDLLGILADEGDVKLEALGSTAFRRQDFERGFEAEACFYFKNFERVLSKAELDMTADPPPDLVVEVDITSPSIAKLPIFAEFGVREVWRFKGERLFIFLLRVGSYQEVDESDAFPGLSAAEISRVLVQGKALDRTAWLRFARKWAREHYGK
jgi:Uma2 family endonuclease